MSDFKLAKRKISGTLDHVIGGAGSDIESTTARTEIIANALRPCQTSDEYVREIRKLWAEAQAKFLAIGRYLVTAKANLDVHGKRGDYERMIANDLPFSRQVAHQLRVVAEAVDSGRLAEGEMPQAYSTAFLLASLPDEQLAVARQRGLVSPLVARTRVLEFRRTLMPRDLGHLRRNRERVIAEIERRQAEIEALQARLAEIDMTIEGSATEINAPAID
jgi:hypothetical protein